MSCEPANLPPLALCAENLSKSYRRYARPWQRIADALLPGPRRGEPFAALQGVSFTLRRGEALGVIGHNGAGKSTLLQLICGTLQPSGGSLTVNGRIAALLELGAGFNPEFSGRENIFLSGAIHGLTRAQIAAKYDEIVDFSGIGDFIEQPVKTYSTGMFVRLAFAIATAVTPDILVIDEALSVGDGAFARKSFDRIMALREQGTTLLFCSHSLYQVETICDQALWLERGRMRMLGTPAEVTRRYLGEMQAPAAQPLAASASASSALCGQGKIVSVTARSGERQGNELSLLAGEETLEVTVRFRFDAALPMPCVAFGIETEAGVAVSSGSSVADGVMPRALAAGEGETVLRFPQLPLAQGRYRLSVFLGCERALHVYDQALYCVEFQVVHGGKVQGVCLLPRCWNDDASRVFVR